MVPRIATPSAAVVAPPALSPPLPIPGIDSSSLPEEGKVIVPLFESMV